VSALAVPTSSGVTGKVTGSHLAKTAYLYVRQSTLRQVLEHTESAQRQYALRQRAIQLGWPTERVVVIDTDQGQSGTSAADREGFQRLVAEVGIGRAGIVLGLEVSRLARNNADWHRLLEICAMSDTLICDEDGLYDPGDFNDRLLLGLKGTMSEAELHFIRARLRGGQLSKARRGELKVKLPVGLVYDPAGNVVLDPDSGVQGALRHLFATFQKTGSARAVVQAFAADGLLFPTRVHAGERKGELTWTPLRHSRVLQTLHNPRYAGAFVYGRHRHRKRPDGTITTTTVPRDRWETLIKDAHPGYLTFEQYEHNQRTLAHNAHAHGPDRAAGPAREGPALLQGLAVCGRCGSRMSTRYHQRAGTLVPDYQCIDEMVQTGTAPACLRVPGSTIDQAIGQLLLDTVTPLALEVALTVQAELEARAAEADQLRQSHVHRTRQRAELARRRYLSVDPDNRLVADTLEADWNQALRDLQTAQDDYQRASTQAVLDDSAKTRIRQLATDFPALWSDPATPDRERKRVARLLIEDVTIDRAENIRLHVRFRAGQTTTLTVPTPLSSWQQRQTNPDTVTALDRLLDDHTDAQAAEQLNQHGHRTGTGQPFTAAIVNDLRRSYHLTSHHARLRDRGLLTITEIAHQLDVHPSTIRHWHAAGLLTSHKANDKNERLFDAPTPGDPRLVKQQGWPLNQREHPRPHQGGAL
jgi:DNA invertase Pin-like site-specific DNA recombinase